MLSCSIMSVGCTLREADVAISRQCTLRGRAFLCSLHSRESGGGMWSSGVNARFFCRGNEDCSFIPATLLLRAVCQCVWG